MKYALIIPDGCADEPQESLAGKTPLQAADIPAMDAVAAAGVVGRANNTPEALPAGSDTANLSLLGYDPVAFYTGRAPLEAAAMGIELGPDDWAVRCNLVTIEEQVMKSFTAGQISTPEAAALHGDAARKTRRRAVAILSRRRLSEFAGLSRGGRAAVVFAGHAHRAAARFDRSIGAGRLSPRAGQRSVESNSWPTAGRSSPSIR